MGISNRSGITLQADGLPPGGIAGQILAKTSGRDYDAEWVTGGGGGSVSDGDYGDIVVTGTGTAWAIDAGVVSNAKFRNSAGLSLVGRSTNTTNSVADITATAANQVMRVNSTGIIIGWGAIDLDSSNAVTGILGSGNLPAEVAYTDVHNTFTTDQDILGNLNVNSINSIANFLSQGSVDDINQSDGLGGWQSDGGFKYSIGTQTLSLVGSMYFTSGGFIYGASGSSYIDPTNSILVDASANPSVDYALKNLFDGSTIAYDWANRALLEAGGSTLIDHTGVFNSAAALSFDTSFILRVKNGIIMEDGTAIAGGTSSGTKIGNSTTQKFSIWNANPITQPGNTIAWDSVLSSFGLRAAGGVSNFNSTLKPKTGAAGAGNVPIQFTSGALLTTAVAGGVEFLTDKYYGTITTGAARKEITLNDAALTSGIVPVATTNGRLTDGGATTTELSYLSGVTSAIQTQLNAMPSVVGTDRKTAQTGAVSLATYTVGAADASYMISANILVTTATLHNFTCTCSYTDESNTARVLTLNFSTLAGVLSPTIANAAGAIPYEGVSAHIRCKASTTIILATTGTFTTVTYNFEERIQKL